VEEGHNPGWWSRQSKTYKGWLIGGGIVVILVIIAAAVGASGDDGATSTWSTMAQTPTSSSTTVPTSATSASTVHTTSTTVFVSKVVNLSAHGTCVDNIVSVQGTASVPDGALISYEVGDAFVDAADGYPAISDGTVPVSGGRFFFEVDISDFPTSMRVVPIWIGFQMIGQPKYVINLYGENGEKMLGQQVVKAGNSRRAELGISVNR